MTLVDTSSWIEQLRERGDPVVRTRVEALLRSGEACWCAMVRLELWNGARGDREKSILRRYERVLPEPATTAEVWDAAFDLARRARGAGITCPASDVLIAACAHTYGCEVEAVDAHFSHLMPL